MLKIDDLKKSKKECKKLRNFFRVVVLDVLDGLK